jgi:hypothetical protein
MEKPHHPDPQARPASRARVRARAFGRSLADGSMAPDDLCPRAFSFALPEGSLEVDENLEPMPSQIHFLRSILFALS